MDSFRRIAAIALVALLGCAFASESQAARPPLGWNKSKATYCSTDNSARVRTTLATAARAWNSLGLKIKLTRVKSCRKANIVIRLRDPSFFLGVAVGNAQTPFKGNRRYLPTRRVGMNLMRSLFYVGDQIQPNQPVALAVSAHEFGHTLGLLHTPQSACALMTPNVRNACGSGITDGDFYQCGPTAADYRRLKRIYRRDGRKRPRYNSCTSLFEAAGTVPGRLLIDSPLEWSIDGTTWNRVDGTAPRGSTIYLREAVSVGAVPFPREFADYVAMSYRYITVGGAETGPGGADLVSSCTITTAQGVQPVPGQSCFGVPAYDPEPGVKGMLPVLEQGNARIWLVRRFKLNAAAGFEVQFANFFTLGVDDLTANGSFIVKTE